MVCSSRMTRVLSALSVTLLVFATSVTLEGGTAAAWARSTTSTTAQSHLSVRSVQVTPDGKALFLDATRPITANDTRQFSVLKFPYPYRLLVDIPNARLTTSKTVIPVNRNGVERIELSASESPFYSAVRAVIYVNDSQTLARLNPSFEGNFLKLEDGAVLTAPSTAAVATDMPPSLRPSTGYKPSHVVQPLPPVTTPMPAMVREVKAPTRPITDGSSRNDSRVSLDSAPGTVLPQAGPKTIMGTPLMPGTNVIESINFQDHRLFVKGAPGAQLRVKNRMTLTAPSRLVLDLDNSVVANRSLLGLVSGDSDEIRRIRVGQFDETTVRLVIETSTPELFEAVFAGRDRNVLAISPYSSTAINRLSSNTRVGEVESIDLKRENGNTILRLTASTPIAHRFLKKDNRITLDLLNESAHPTPIAFDEKLYPEIDKMRLEPLTEGQPNSKLFIALSSRNVRVVPSLSNDGRVMELMFSASDEEEAQGAAAVFGPAGKAPFAARIVLDAGHGGKDIGANRSGVYEKDLNLSLALLVRDALVAKGFKVYMTRSTDVFLPLPQITAITNQVHPDLFISIHHNASVNPAVNGLETYYFTPQSIPLAKRVHAREIDAVGVRDGGVKQARFYVIHHTDVPAILCEVGYVSNPDELSDLQTMERKLKTARSISDGVVDYLKTRVSAKAR